MSPAAPERVSVTLKVHPRPAAAIVTPVLDLTGEFWDIGTPEDWERAERHFAS